MKITLCKTHCDNGASAAPDAVFYHSDKRCVRSSAIAVKNAQGVILAADLINTSALAAR